MNCLVVLFSFLTASAQPHDSWLFEAPRFPFANTPRVMTIGARSAEKNILFQFATNPGASYRFEATSRFGVPRWSPIGGAFVATGPLLAVNVTPVGAGNFYRLVELTNEEAVVEWTKGLESMIGYGSIAH